MLREVIKESIVESKVISEAFSDKNIEKVAKLLAKLATKKLGDGKYFPFLGQWYRDEFISNGKKGIGFRFLSEKGNMIRFGFQNPDTKAKKLKDKFLVNRVDYWIPDGEAKFDKPSRTILLQPWLNIVEVTDEIFTSLKTGEVVESLKEGAIVEANIPKKLISYALYKGLRQDEIDSVGSGRSLINMLKDAGVWDDDEYKGYKVTKGTKEVDNVSKDLDTVVKKIKRVDPDVVFEDVEKLTELIAKNILKQNGLIITGAPGIGKCKPGYEEVNIKGI